MTEQEFKEIELTQDSIESIIYAVRGQKSYARLRSGKNLWL